MYGGRCGDRVSRQGETNPFAIRERKTGVWDYMACECPEARHAVLESLSKRDWDVVRYLAIHSQEDPGGLIECLRKSGIYLIKPDEIL